MIGLGIGGTVGSSYIGESFIDPSSIASIALWYKHRTGYIDTTDDRMDMDSPPAEGTNIKKWEDQVGSNDAVQLTGADQPKLQVSERAVHFKNNVKYFNLTSEITIAGDFSMCIRAQIDHTSVASDTFIGDSSNDVIQWANANAFNLSFGGSGTTTISGGAALAVDTYYNFIFVRKSGTVTLYINGAAWGNTVSDTDDFTVTNLGSQNPEGANWKGRWQSFSYFDEALSDGDINNMTNYLEGL